MLTCTNIVQVKNTVLAYSHVNIKNCTPMVILQTQRLFSITTSTALKKAHMENQTRQHNLTERVGELNQKGIREIQKSRYNKRSCLSRLRQYQACIKIEAHQRGKKFTTPTVAEEKTRDDSKTQDLAPVMETETILHCVITMLAHVHSGQLSTQVPGRRQKMWYPEKGHNRLSILFYLLHIAFQLSCYTPGMWVAGAAKPGGFASTLNY